MAYSGFVCGRDGIWRSGCPCRREVELRAGEILPTCVVHGDTSWARVGDAPHQKPPSS